MDAEARPPWSHLRRWSSWLLVAGLPALLSLLLVRWQLGVGWSAHAPEGLADLTSSTALLWSDELDNWHEVRTFVTHGFAGGYYTFDERLAPLPWPRFGTHGPVYPLLYGLMGRVAGWQLSSGPAYNAVLLGLGVLIFIILARPDRRQLLFLAGALATCWPMLLFIPSTMQESFHQAVALVLAGCFAAWWRQGAAVGTGSRVAVYLVIAVAALSRPTWCFVALPFLLLAAPPGARARWRVAGYLLACACAFLVSRLVAAPYPTWYINSFFASLSRHPGLALLELLTHLQTNVENWCNPRQVGPLIVAQRLQLSVLLIAGLVGVTRGVRARQASEPTDGVDREALLHVLNLGLPLLFVLVVYDTYFYRDYRFLAPNLLLSWLVLIARRRFRLAGVVLLLMLAATPWFLQEHRELHRRHFADETALMQRFGNRLAGFVAYRAHANPWCNSLLGDADLFPFLKTVPSGIGIGITTNWREVPRPFKSKYLLVGSGRMLPPTDHVRLLDHEGWQLYLNLDARCEPGD